MSLRVKFATLMSVCAALSVSCVKDVTLDAMADPTLVVECVLTDKPVQTLHLVYTKGASRAEAPDLLEAEAVLTDLTEGKEVGRFARTADRSWTLAYAAIPEHRYRLDVTVPGHDPIWAEQTMPEAPGVEVGWRGLEMGKDFDNPQLLDNDVFYYPLIMKYSNIGYTFRLTYNNDPVWFYGINYPTLESPGEETPYLCTNSLAVDPFNMTEGWNFTEESDGNYLWGDKRKSGFRTTCYPDLSGIPLYRRYLRFVPGDIDPDEEFLISGYFQGYISSIKDFLHAEMRPAELHWFSASEDYDRFLQDSYHLIDLKNSTDLADIFVRDNVYGNIHGTIGLFGARIERIMEWEGRETWETDAGF